MSVHSSVDESAGEPEVPSQSSPSSTYHRPLDEPAQQFSPGGLQKGAAVCASDDPGGPKVSSGPEDVSHKALENTRDELPFRERDSIDAKTLEKEVPGFEAVEGGQSTASMEGEGSGVGLGEDGHMGSQRESQQRPPVRRKRASSLDLGWLNRTGRW